MSGTDPDGIVLADKPAGKTSHDITTVVRRGLGVRKAGHAGTLDPFATGLLVVLVGRARRVQRFFTALPKEYFAVARFGAVSTTGDPDGQITQTGVLPAGDLVLPTGRITQRPPAYSAIRIDGTRAYERARRGETVEVPEREVTIYEFEQLWREEDRAGLRIVCSSGTYVRSLVADLGDAYTEELRRTSIGPFHVDDANARTRAAAAGCTGLLRAPRGGRRARAQRGARRRDRASAGAPGTGGGVGAARAAERGAAERRGRPDRAGRAPRGRSAQARRRLPGVRITLLPDAEPRARRVAVGTFDGVHLGHREVISGADTVLTFDPHPTAVVAPGKEPQLLTTLARKAELAGAAGAQELVVIPFDREFAQRTAQEFIDDVLVGRLGATHVSVGENFHFGNRARATRRCCARSRASRRASSRCWRSTVRSSARATFAGSCSAGALEYAGRLLGEPFVVDGDRLARR